MATRVNLFKRKEVQNVPAVSTGDKIIEKSGRGELPGFRGKGFGVCSIVFFFDFIKSMTFGILAIVFGSKKKSKGTVALGIIGISSTVLFYLSIVVITLLVLFSFTGILTTIIQETTGIYEYFASGQFYEYAKTIIDNFLKSLNVTF